MTVQLCAEPRQDGKDEFGDVTRTGLAILPRRLWEKPGVFHDLNLVMEARRLMEELPKDEGFVPTTAETVCAEMSDTIATTLRRPHEDFKALYGRIAAALTCRAKAYIVTDRQIRRLHHREWREPPAHLVDNIRALAAEARRRAGEAREAAIAAERDAISELRREIATMRERLNALDPDFHSPSIAALGEMVPRPIENTEPGRGDPERGGRRRPSTPEETLRHGEACEDS